MPATIAQLPPTIRVFRARAGESVADARERRAELVTLDVTDLLRVLRRCQTTLHAGEIASLERAVRALPEGTAADVVLAPGGRVWVDTKKEPEA